MCKLKIEHMQLLADIDIYSMQTMQYESTAYFREIKSAKTEYCVISIYARLILL